MFNGAYNQIIKAQRIAEKATTVFNKTINELKEVNEELRDVILSENQWIEEHENNIISASRQITSNDKVIEKLQDFIV